MESLILQRMGIDRMRTQARFLLFGGMVWSVPTALALADDPARLSGWGFALFSMGWIVAGIRQLAKYRAAVDTFEAEHGADAGKQEPVRMPRRGPE